METYIIRLDMDKDLTLTGEEIASVASTSDKPQGHWYSGYISEWTELSLYKTQAGALACGHYTTIKIGNLFLI